MTNKFDWREVDLADLMKLVGPATARGLYGAFGLRTIEEVATLSDAQIMSVYGIGKMVVYKIRNAIKESEKNLQECANRRHPAD
jgi:ERCC4-type nuclease